MHFSSSICRRLLRTYHQPSLFPCVSLANRAHTAFSRHATQSVQPLSSKAVVAVLYQALEPPIVNGVRKPAKPGGYQDSGADIAYSLQKQAGIDVVTPIDSPDPADQSAWCFPDTEEGILSALSKGATHLWANTILFASHPLQVSQSVRKYQDQVNVIGQPPTLVEQFDDKNYVNSLLRTKGTFTMPRSWILNAHDKGWKAVLDSMSYPVVGKPIRGRGSHGVKKCDTKDELEKHVESLFSESPSIMVEEYLSGEESTVTVMPRSKEKNRYWSMPIVTRFNHVGGIAPYNGVVAVTANSRVVTKEEYAKDPNYDIVARECEAVAEELRPTAPIRIDVRRFKNDASSKFALFDINMKPNMTGPGRPGRDDQASLTLLAAAGLGWDYPRLLSEMLKSSSSLRVLRHRKPENK
ncbi:glutathione synthetase ATP-binding domain-like protein [Aaosphaeria arxii CBS 175.79]|uniref:Glutathione synthetase ATP-binding domain-like protein n=1 Tax=Aaosphaeria arxii CBS 175.79 TaxID=1450172 RepID=A0A6A5XRR0_9PLEO|nr:glutathione synthetase ATP-binding domain-like protein [Aaosphaeria arxii CBS 175.79]KAF2014984.1 glutathione synthetase ATP-binding domain-like protein [Aaosphaeria arxii CBS 175.79]